jgi:hypothetical protein
MKYKLFLMSSIIKMTIGYKLLKNAYGTMEGYKVEISHKTTCPDGSSGKEITEKTGGKTTKKTICPDGGVFAESSVEIK